jgi:hypothetical protein
MNSKNTLLVAAIVAVLGLAGCNNQDSAVDAQRKVEEARVKAAEEVAKAQTDAVKKSEEAQRELDAARAEARADVAAADAKANETINDATTKAMDQAKEAGHDVAKVEANTIETQAKAAYDLAVTQADANLKVAKERCETLPSGQVGPCKDQADAAYETAKANAKRALDDANTAAADAKR